MGNIGRTLMKSTKGCEIEIICTGQEILYGRIVDTNSAWISKQATEHGAVMQRIVCVGDDVDEIKREVREGIVHGYDLILTTGGLGPTADDVTIEAVSEAVGLRVVLDEGAIAILRRRLEERSKTQRTTLELTSRRLKMATMVEGAIPIDNPVGLAPGMELKVGKTLIVSLPGVPDEMKAIFETHTLPIIDKMSTRKTAAKTIRIALSGEAMALAIREIEKTFPLVYLKTYAADIIADLGMRTDIVVEGSSDEECQRIIQKVLDTIASSVVARGGTWRME